VKAGVRQPTPAESGIIEDAPWYNTCDHQEHCATVREDSVPFEWDEEKNATNIQKHGIDFADVHIMFQSPMLLNIDDRIAYGEELWIGISPLYMIIAVGIKHRITTRV
jgi:uncharacterized DUF497 family protein